MNAETPLRKFHVLISVTRGEYYELEAADEADAMRRAFEEGRLVDTGDTTDVTELEAVEIDAFTALD